MKLQKYLVSVLGCSLLLCSFTSTAAPVRIGIDFATQNEARYYKEGYYLQEKLRAKGYDVELFYGGDGDVGTQRTQILRMLNDGCKVMLIAAVNARGLDEELRRVKEKGVTVIAYDRLLMDTENVDYCVSFNNESSGYLIADYFERKLNLRLHGPDNPMHIEIFAGSPDDKSARSFWDGAMTVLDPYIMMGSAVVGSGEKDFDTCKIDGWSSYLALQRMEKLLKEQGYGPGGKPLDAILSPSDSISQGIVLALDAAGYTRDNYPVVTGQDCDAVSINNMLQGKQTLSVFKDGRQLADAAVQMVEEIVNGKEVSITNTFSYDNGKIVVPAVEVDTVMVDINNYEKILVESGFMTRDEINNPPR